MADNKHDQAATITRRSAMQAGAGALLASGVPLFWSGEARADKAKVDAVLGGAVSSGNVPGVVALAADDKGVIYEGAFGKRNLATGTAMTSGHDVLDRLDDQGGDLDGRHADGRAGQAQSRQADQRRRLRAAGGAGAGGLRCRGQAQAQAAQAADHAPPSADPHGRLQLRPVEQGYRALHEGRQHTRHRHLQARGPEGAADRRPRRQVGVRHQHRLGRQGGRAGERPVAGWLYARPHLHPARHEGHGLHPEARPAGAPGERSCPRRRRQAGPDRLRHAAGARILHGRRRPLLDRARLPHVPAHAAGRRQARHRAAPEARDRRR